MAKDSWTHWAHPLAICLLTIGVVNASASRAGAFELTSDQMELPPNSQVVLTLRMSNDTGAGSSDPADVCHEGTGDDVCAWDVTVQGTGGVTFDAVDHMGNDVVSAVLSPTEIKANGGDPIEGDPGSVLTPLFAVTVNTGAAGGQVSASADWVDAGLNLLTEEAAVLAQVAAAEPDADGDTIPDDVDPCPSYPNALPLVYNSGSTGGVFPVDCLCGDANGDGALRASDGQKIARCSVRLDLTCDPDIADTTGEGTLRASDGFRVSQASVRRIPIWDLTCPRRPEGTEPPSKDATCAVVDCAN